MTPSRIALIFAALTALAWGAKAVAIWLAGGLDRSPAEGPLFFAGLVFGLVAVGALGLSTTDKPQWWARIGAVVGAVVILVIVVALTSATLQAIATSDHWVWSELNLWVISLAVLVLSVGRHQKELPGGTAANAAQPMSGQRPT